ncbi:MAG: hypothetical protein IKS29_04700 [Oscillospiraceae bacterium]|nr:hypothetical protein [Oscillospiraceae bacterium]
MLLLGYLLGFAAVALLMKKRSESARGLVLVGYNYLFTVVMFTFNRLSGQSLSWQSVTEVILKSIYSSPPALTFRGSMNDTRSLQQVAILCIMSIYTLRTAFVLFFRKALNLFRMSVRVRWARELYVLWGGREEVQILLADLQKQVRRPAAVWIPFSGKGEMLLGALTEEERFLERIRKNRECRIVLLPDPQGGNLDRLDRLDKLCSSRAPFHVTAFLEDDTLRLNALLFEHLDAYLVSAQELLCQRLWQQRRPLQLVQTHGEGSVQKGVYIPARPFRLSVVGFDPLAKAFLLSSAEQAAFETAAPGGLGMEAQVFQASPEAWEGFRLDYPAATLFASMERREDAPDRALCGALADPEARPDCILLSQPETGKNLELAKRLLRQMDHLGMPEQARPWLLVRAGGADKASLHLLKDRGEVNLIQDQTALLSYEALILRADDQGAEALHENYSRHNPNAARWYGLDTFTQDSNRAALRDRENKRLLARDLETDREQTLWELSKYEHRRWEAFYATHGWIRLPEEELTPAERASYATKRTQERRHSCLCVWDELDALPQREPGLLKRYDYENVLEVFAREE